MADAPPPSESSESYAAAHALEYKNRGNAKFKERDYEGAVQAFSEAIALDPSNAVLYSNRSGAYLAMSHVSKAFKDAEEAVRLDPTWPKALARRATAEHALTRYITAQATWRKALQLDPGNEAYEKALQAAKDGEAQQTKERIEDEKRKEREAEEKRRRDAADEAKRREDARNEEQLKRVHHRVGARVDDGDDEAAVGNTRPRGAARFALKSPRSQKKEAATVVQAQFRGRQARSLSSTPGAGLRCAQPGNGAGRLSSGVRSGHGAGIHLLIKVGFADVAKLQGRLLQRQPLMVGMLSDGTGLLVTDARG